MCLVIISAASSIHSTALSSPPFHAFLALLAAIYRLLSYSCTLSLYLSFSINFASTLFVTYCVPIIESISSFTIGFSLSPSPICVFRLHSSTIFLSSSPNLPHSAHPHCLIRLFAFCTFRLPPLFATLSLCGGGFLFFPFLTTFVGWTTASTVIRITHHAPGS